MTAFESRALLRRSPVLWSARRRRAGGLVAGMIAVLVLPALVAAHPLGNFTINHYAGLRIETNRILLDLVIDQAEIPTFQARLAFDLDGDGDLSDTEIEHGRVTACQELAPALDLRVGGSAVPITLTEAGLTFPPGAGGLSTMRTVCGFEAAPSAPLAAATEITFADRSFSERIGWREIVVTGSGVMVAPSGTNDELRTVSPSARLTAYPADLLTQAPADAEVTVMATPGGPVLPDLEILDAEPINADSGTQAASMSGGEAASVSNGAAASVPGGVAPNEIPSIFRSVDLTPIVLLVSLLTAAALGAGHALTPGHGKTLIAAYLVGSRGSPAHAAGLGLSVALSHTFGILVLAGLVVGAQSILPPEVVIRAAPILAAVSIVAIGGWMLITEGRRRWAARKVETAAGHDHTAGHDHEHDHASAHGHDHEHDHESADDHVRDHTAGHDHDHESAPAHDHKWAHDHDHGTGEHSHGGRAHTHLPATGAGVTWRSLFVLGLAGGLIPSANALVILLVSIAAGRPAFGFVLVVAFGLGMALVMAGIGLAMTLARSRLDRMSLSSPLGRLGAWLPLAASAFVLSFGVLLTIQAVSGNATF